MTHPRVEFEPTHPQPFGRSSLKKAWPQSCGYFKRPSPYNSARVAAAAKEKEGGRDEMKSVVYIYIYIYMYIYIYIYVYVYVYTHAYIHTYIHTYICVYRYTYMHIYTYTYTYIHTYTYTPCGGSAKDKYRLDGRDLRGARTDRQTHTYIYIYIYK